MSTKGQAGRESQRKRGWVGKSCVVRFYVCVCVRAFFSIAPVQPLLPFPTVAYNDNSTRSLSTRAKSCRPFCLKCPCQWGRSLVSEHTHRGHRLVASGDLSSCPKKVGNFAGGGERKEKKGVPLIDCTCIPSFFFRQTASQDARAAAGRSGPDGRRPAADGRASPPGRHAGQGGEPAADQPSLLWQRLHAQHNHGAGGGPRLPDLLCGQPGQQVSVLDQEQGQPHTDRGQRDLHIGQPVRVPEQAALHSMDTAD